MSSPWFLVEVITLPVSDVERALRFYVDQMGFTLDVDYAPTDAFRVAQLTPHGSSCSIQLGTGLADAPAGSVRHVHLILSDLVAAPDACSIAVSRSARSATTLCGHFQVSESRLLT